MKYSDEVENYAEQAYNEGLYDAFHVIMDYYNKKREDSELSRINFTCLPRLAEKILNLRVKV
jgi:hypothetical protein